MAEMIITTHYRVFILMGDNLIPAGESRAWWGGSVDVATSESHAQNLIMVGWVGRVREAW